MFQGFLVVVLVPFVLGTTKEDDLVTELPLANFHIPFKHYSGFLQASEAKHFHYWYVIAWKAP